MRGRFVWQEYRTRNMMCTLFVRRSSLRWLSAVQRQIYFRCASHLLACIWSVIRNQRDTGAKGKERKRGKVYNRPVLDCKGPTSLHGHALKPYSIFSNVHPTLEMRTQVCPLRCSSIHAPLTVGQQPAWAAQRSMQCVHCPAGPPMLLCESLTSYYRCSCRTNSDEGAHMSPVSKVP